MMSSNNLLHRRAVVNELLRDRGDLLVIGGLGAPAWDLTAAGDHPNSFPLWGAMGSAALIGLGLAIAQPERRVLVLTGDGEMLMGIGALATIGEQQPKKLSVVVLDNERYGETGMQKTHTASGLDMAKMAAAAGFPTTRVVRTAEEVTRLCTLVQQGVGPVFAQVKIDPEKLKLVLPPSEGSYLKNRFRESVLGPQAIFQ
jgi:thiamine pyrophosphate-dependent acetolactate synthase large subunit-like protein